jgi:hypothetical protein
MYPRRLAQNPALSFLNASDFRHPMRALPTESGKSLARSELFHKGPKISLTILFFIQFLYLRFYVQYRTPMLSWPLEEKEIVILGRMRPSVSVNFFRGKFVLGKVFLGCVLEV